MTSDAGRRDKWQESWLKLADPETLEWQSAQQNPAECCHTLCIYYAFVRKNPAKSMAISQKRLGSLGSADGHLVPDFLGISMAPDPPTPPKNGYLVPEPQKPPVKVRLDGNQARRGRVEKVELVVWDEELGGFGMCIQPTGTRTWFVRLRQRGKHRRISLGRAEDIDAPTARAAARALLAKAALDGLPQRPQGRAAPLFRDYVAEFWTDYARHWKLATERRNRALCQNDLTPTFGDLPLTAIVRADVLRWRDSLSTREGVFNRTLPVLAVMLRYAEQLGYRRKGSNPCRGIPRYRRQLPERYLSPPEYRRLSVALGEAEGQHPAEVAAIKLLLFTGARCSEITDLQWAWVQPQRLMLPDSKTGPMIIWLNRQAEAILRGLPRGEGGLVFPGRGEGRPIRLGNFWSRLRRRCLLLDVRLHDLRHSFASTAIMQGVPLATIGKLLGHVLPETTARYAHLADDTVAEAAQRVSGSVAACLGLAR